VETTQNRAITTRRPRPTRAAGLIGLGAAFFLPVILLTFANDQNLPVMLPLMVATGGIIFFFWALWQRRGALPYFEIGVIYAIAVALYTLYPLIGFILNGLSYTPLNDARLFLAEPTPIEIGKIGWYYVVHLLAFIVVYLLARGRLPRGRIRFQKPSRAALLAVIGAYIIISGFFLFLGQFFDLSASTYGESYLVYSRLPLLLAQLAGHLGGARFTLELAVLAALFFDYQKYRLLIVIWLASIALLTLVRLGSRTELMLLFLAAGMQYYYLVRPIPFRLISLAGLFIVGLFLLLGMLRSGQTFSRLNFGFNPFAYASEFETVFANAYDLHRLKSAGLIGNLPLTFYLSDLFALIPQQLVPFAKMSPSTWYVNTFYPAYAAIGGGLAFGTISESILGGGWIDLIVRGAVLGFILAQIHRVFVFRQPSFWFFVLDVWLTVQVYQLFRNTTFSLLVLFFYRFLTVIVGVKILSAILRGGAQTHLSKFGP
jgi:oligosaccharide repeat unit polymerase